ncbi:hypothetical protein ACU8OS_35240 (plasmid) [Rhizobium leguminosarum]
MINRRAFCACGLALAGVHAVPRASLAQELLNLNGSVACAGTKSITLGNIWSFKASSEAEELVGKICDAVGLAKNFEVRAAAIDEDIKNAAAVIANYGTPDAKRLVLYNELWVQDRLKSTGEEYWSGVSLLAHECGHHLSGHTLDGQGSKPPKELEADKFAGFIVARLGGTVEQAQALFNTFSEQGSDTHPARKDRVQAVAVGWRMGAQKTPDERAPDPRPDSGPDPVWTGINVVYYRQKWDGPKVDNALSQLKIRAEEREPEKSRSLIPSSAVICSYDVPVRAVRALALALYDAGVPIRAISRPRDENFSGIAIYVADVDIGELSRSSIEELDSCPSRDDPVYGAVR